MFETDFIDEREIMLPESKVVVSDTDFSAKKAINSLKGYSFLDKVVNVSEVLWMFSVICQVISFILLFFGYEYIYFVNFCCGCLYFFCLGMERFKKNNFKNLIPFLEKKFKLSKSNSKTYEKNYDIVPGKVYILVSENTNVPIYKIAKGQYILFAKKTIGFRIIRYYEEDDKEIFEEMHAIDDYDELISAIPDYQKYIDQYCEYLKIMAEPSDDSDNLEIEDGDHLDNVKRLYLEQEQPYEEN